MRIQHIRVANVNKGTRQYCISHVYINDVYSHDCIEDIDRGLDQSWSLADIKAKKVKSKTAIPTGTYKVTLNVVSPKFGASTYAGGYYKNFCQGKVPRLLNVPGYDGILIHKGTNENSSAGCLIVGYNKVVGAVVDSQKVFERIYKQMKEAIAKGESIEYCIMRKYKV